MLVKKDKAIIFNWLATCDLATKTGKYIELTHNTSRYHNKIDAIAFKLSTIKAQIQARYKHSSIILLECPPYSIEHYNKCHGHEKASKFRSQTLLLENQIFYLNRQIKQINHERQHYSRERMQADHKSYEDNNTGKQQQNMTLESSTYDFRENVENQTSRTDVEVNNYFLEKTGLQRKPPDNFQKEIEQDLDKIQRQC